MHLFTLGNNNQNCIYRPTFTCAFPSHIHITDPVFVLGLVLVYIRVSFVWKCVFTCVSANVSLQLTRFRESFLTARTSKHSRLRTVQIWSIYMYMLMFLQYIHYTHLIQQILCVYDWMVYWVLWGMSEWVTLTLRWV